MLWGAAARGQAQAQAAAQEQAVETAGPRTIEDYKQSERYQHYQAQMKAWQQEQERKRQVPWWKFWNPKSLEPSEHARSGGRA